MKLSLNYINQILSISNFKGKIFFLIFLSLASSLCDILSLGLLLPVISIFFNQQSDTLNISIFSNFISDGEIGNIEEIILIIFLLIFFLKTVSSIIIYKFIVKIKLDLQAKLRVDLLTIYGSLDYLDFIKRQSSDYIQNITAVVTVYSNVLMSLLRIISEIIIILAIVSYLIVFSSEIILTILPIFIVFIIFYQIFFKKKIQNIGKFVNQDSKSMIQVINDAVMGLKELKISNRQIFFVNIIKKLAKNLAKNSLRYEVILYSPRYLIEFIFILLIISYIYYNLNESNSNQIYFVQVAATYGYVALRLIPSFSLISRMMAIMNNGITFTNTLYSDLKNSKDLSVETDYEKNLEIDNLDFKSLEFENVTFSYDAKEIIKNINFKINRGENLIIHGPSGSGKSTLVDLMLGFLMPSSGKIKVNSSISLINNLRSNSYYLSQNKFLFNESIFNNIVMDESKENFTDLDDNEKIFFEQVIKLSNLEDLVSAKDQGVNFKIGEGGKYLSGGQKQRLSIARALYSKRQIIVFDEATSEMDNALEEQIYKNLLKNKFDNKTIIVISHNQNLIKYFKNKIVLN